MCVQMGEDLVERCDYCDTEGLARSLSSGRGR